MDHRGPLARGRIGGACLEHPALVGSDDEAVGHQEEEARPWIVLAGQMDEEPVELTPKGGGV
jgi:hypothetical protein